jgi:poly(hydroxyalkanoate) granule-associated protein
MLKKAKAEARADTSSAKDRAQSMLDSSRQIWLAGLGAFARAKGEGRKVFDTLVKQGESLEKETRNAAASTAAAAREAAAEGAARVQTIAGDTWDKLEKVFEDRVAKALARLGVHTQSDVEQLSQRVDALADAVNELIRAQGGKPKARRSASPVKRIVKSTLKSATRTAKGAATSASNAAGGAARTAGKGVRVARKVAKAAPGK